MPRMPSPMPSRQACALSWRDFDTRMFAMNMELSTALVQINDQSKNGTVYRPVHYAESTAFHTACAAVSLILSGRLNCSLRMRCINSTPALTMAALPSRLTPSITLTLNLMFRWSCLIRLFKYFEHRIFVSKGSKLSSLLDRQRLFAPQPAGLRYLKYCLSKACQR